MDGAGGLYFAQARRYDAGAAASTLISGIWDMAGEWFVKAMNKSGRGSITQVYKMADTKIHNGTWSFKRLSLKTWGKCVESESYAAFPGVFVSQLENAVQDGASNIQETIYKETMQDNLTSVSSNQTYIKGADIGEE